jgi:hypothetical protein
VAEDINGLVLLMDLSPDDKELYFLKPSRNNVVQRVYSTKTNLNQFVNIKKGHLFFIHAFTGCMYLLIILHRLFIKKSKNQFFKIFNYDNNVH